MEKILCSFHCALSSSTRFQVVPSYDVHGDLLIKTVSARLSHYKVILCFSVIHKYFERRYFEMI